MPSMDTIRQLGSAVLQNIARPETFAAVGAMLICAAVVLGVGPFAKAPGVSTGSAPPVRAAGSVSWQEVALSAADLQAAIQEKDQETAEEPEAAPAVMELAWVSSATALPMRIQSAADSQEPAPQEVASVEEPEPAREAEPAKRPGVAGVWSADACSPRSFKDGTLPTVINAEGAWAGETFCVFNKRKETESGWRVVATCSSPRARWTSNVRLTVSDNRLTWASERGTQIYTRCASDVLMAQAR